MCKKIFFSIFFSFLFDWFKPAFSFTEEEFLKKAEEEVQKGITGRMHGSVAETQQFIFTWRPDPKEFRAYFDFPLIPLDKKMIETLEKTSRHDEVKLVGKIRRFPAPHIELSEFEITKKFNPEEAKSYERDLKALKELRELKEAHFLVHAVLPDQGMLLLEYKDWIFPYTGLKKKELKDANYVRNDLVRAQFEIQEYPDRPTHLTKPQDIAAPIKVVEAIKDQHGKTTTMQGILVKFAKVPTTTKTFYAIEVVNEKEISFNYMLVNLKGESTDEELYKKVSQIWKDNEKTVALGRNRFRNPAVKIKLTGTIGVVGPQLTVEDIENFEIQK